MLHPQIPEHHTPGRGGLGPLHLEAAVLVAHVVVEQGHELGVQLQAVGLELPFTEAAAVKKDMRAAGMSMEIEASVRPLAVGLQAADVLFHTVDGGVGDRVRLQPLAVEVVPRQRTPIVAVDDPVRVQTRKNMETKIPTQFHRFLCVTHQELQQTVAHPRSIRLARVLACRDDNPRLEQSRVNTLHLVEILRGRVRAPVGNQQEHQGDAEEGLPQKPAPDHIPEGGRLQPVHHGHDHAVGVGKMVGEEHAVAVEGEGVRELQAAVGLSVLLRHPGLPPHHVRACAGLPPRPIHVGIHQRLHPVHVQRLLLREVVDREPGGAPGHCVGDREIVPLVMTVGIGVVVDQEGVLVVTQGEGRPQIPRLEAGRKEQMAVVIA
mmetsp:Transcript_75616/g.202105  ORF Transcript_75616/g.202105 Transcript_75616/m.202105 type:complete len:377 (-) Transcript_75616:354-1484(-)